MTNLGNGFGQMEANCRGRYSPGGPIIDARLELTMECNRFATLIKIQKELQSDKKDGCALTPARCLTEAYVDVNFEFQAS